MGWSWCGCCGVGDWGGGRASEGGTSRKAEPTPGEAPECFRSAKEEAPDIHPGLRLRLIRLARSHAGGRRFVGALAERVELVLDLAGDAAVGEVADDGLADADGLGPLVVLDGDRELRAEVVDLFLEEVADRVLHLVGLGPRQIGVELL